MSDDLMNDLQAAASEVSTSSAGKSDAVADVQQVAAEVAKPAAAERVRDESGRFSGKGKTEDKGAKDEVKDKPAAEPEEKTKEEAKPAEPEEKPAAEATPPKPAASKPPQSWKPHAREKWASLPPEVQEEAVRIDKEVHRVLQESAASRKFYESFEKVLTPYKDIIQGEPLAVVGNLFATAKQLQRGSPQDKATLVARIVQDFGVPLEALDAALSGQPAQPGAQQAQAQANPAQYRDPRVDDLLSRLEQGKTARAQRQQQEVQREIEAFRAEAEFFDDVRELAADLMEVSARRGVELSMRDAYNQAVRIHPEVSKVLAGRESAAAANAQQASTQRARVAASSVKTEPTGGVSPVRSGSVLDDLQASVAALSGR